MCGICGVIQVSGEPRQVIASHVLDHMADVMTHRGPDDRGTYIAPGVALGARRLSIIDVEHGHQPFSNEDDSVWAVQNGELYNHDALRAELQGRGHRFSSRCDTEVLPHLYERDGASFAKRLRGKFALAVWDAKRRRAVLARDRLGVKPLYYAIAGDLLVFASELKSLLATDLVGDGLDYEAIDAYLALGFVPGPRTPLAEVSKLMPGHMLVIENGAVRRECYWRYPAPAPGPASLGVEHYVDRLLEELEEAVRLRLMSDVPLGAMLSGGIDSSLVVALMAKHASGPVKTFTVGFADGPNELEPAREVARTLGADHHEIELSLADEVDLSTLVWHLDEPLADLSAVGFLAISELASRHVTVALSGQGADELLGGYKRHRNAALVESFGRLPGVVQRAGIAAARQGSARIRRAAGALAAADSSERFVNLRRRLIAPELRRELVTGPLARLDGQAALRAVEARVNGVDAGPLSATLYLDAQLGLVDDMLHYFDRTSMARSLEVRVPFLDHRVVELAATIPTSFKVRGLTTKYVLRRAARGVVPDWVIDRPKVGFFNSSVDAWFDAQVRGAISDYLVSPAPRYAEILDRSRVEQLVADHGKGARDGVGDALLAVLILEVWLSSFLPRALRLPAPQRETIRLGA